MALHVRCAQLYGQKTGVCKPDGVITRGFSPSECATHLLLLHERAVLLQRARVEAL